MIPIVAFYSFKGGVGRTLSVIGVALRLYKEGRRVLVVDCDLEAPGITLAPPFDKHPSVGVIDLVGDLLASKAGDFYAPCLHEMEVGSAMREGGCLAYLPVGVINDPKSNYIQRMEDFQSRFTSMEQTATQRFFTEFRACLENVANERGERVRPDVILMDLRTGLNSLSLRVVEYLADLLVVVSALNNQNILGLAGFLGLANSFERRVPRIQVASPIPQGDFQEKRDRLAFFESQTEEGIDVTIEWVSSLALGDHLPSLEDVEKYLYNAHAQLTRLVRERLHIGPQDLLATVRNAWRERHWNEAGVAFLELAVSSPDHANSLIAEIRPADNEQMVSLILDYQRARALPWQVEAVLGMHLQACMAEMDLGQLRALERLYEALRNKIHLTFLHTELQIGAVHSLLALRDETRRAEHHRQAIERFSEALSLPGLGPRDRENGLRGRMASSLSLFNIDQNALHLQAAADDAAEILTGNKSYSGYLSESHHEQSSLFEEDEKDLLRLATILFMCGHHTKGIGIAEKLQQKSVHADVRTSAEEFLERRERR